MVSTGTLARERDKFFELLRAKYPEHGKGIEDFLSCEDTPFDKVCVGVCWCVCGFVVCVVCVCVLCYVVQIDV